MAGAVLVLAPSVSGYGRTPATQENREEVGAPPHWQPIPLRSIGCQCGGPLLRSGLLQTNLYTTLAPIRFESNRQVFHAGEVQFFDHVDREGKIWFRGGLFWPHANLVMEPAFYVQRLPKQQKSLPVLVVHHESSGDRIKWFSGLPPAEITIIRSDEPKEFCKDFALDLRQVAAAKKQSAVARIVNGEWMMDVDGLFEPPGIWRKMIHTLSPHSREVRKPTVTEKPVGETSHCKAPPKPSHSVSLNPTNSVQLPSKEAVTPNEREIEELRKAAGESSQQRRPKRILTETPERNSATEQDIN